MINGIDSKDEWLLQRWGKFTASMIYKILKKGVDGTGFSAGAMTYIEERAIESMTELYEAPEMEFVEPLMHGKHFEEAAFNRYVHDTKNYGMEHFGSENPLFMPYNEYSGGSPDGKLSEPVKWIWEGKCPKNPKNHLMYLKMKDQWDLKEKRIEYYSQIQFLIMIFKADGAHFSSYDERWKEEKLQNKIIEVLPDKKFQDNLEIRLHLAQKERLNIIDKLMSLQ